MTQNLSPQEHEYYMSLNYGQPGPIRYAGNDYYTMTYAHRKTRDEITRLLLQKGVGIICETGIDRIEELAASLDSCEAAVQLFINAPTGKKYIKETQTLKRIQLKEI